MAGASKVAVVTGGNKGIGFAIVRQLCCAFAGDVFLTARNEELGTAACVELEGEGLHPKFHQLDITDNKSIERLRDFLKSHYGGIDVLVNNAGVAYKSASTATLAEKARVTVNTNFSGTLNVCHELFPLLRAESRVVNVASRVGRLKLLDGSPWQSKFTSPSLTEEELVGLMKTYVSSVEQGKEKADGWPRDSPYCMSKLAEIALTKVQAKHFAGLGGVLVNCCCPGYVDTDMSSHKGHLTPDQGAETPVYLALLPAGGVSGEFFYLKKRAVW